VADLEYAFNNTYNYRDNQQTSSFFYFLHESLNSIFWPGDRIAVFQFGIKDPNAARIDKMETDHVVFPEIPPPPKPVAGYTPLPTPTLSGIPLDDQKGKNNFQKEQESYNLTLTTTAEINKCLSSEWENSYKVTATAWAATKEAINSAFLAEYENLVSPLEDYIQRTEEEKIVEMGFKAVFEGLANASNDFTQQCQIFHRCCSEFDRCILIVVDDLYDHRQTKPESYLINLENVEVLVLMPHCKEIYDCKEVQDRWTELFQEYRARSVVYVNADHLDTVLSEYTNGDFAEFPYTILSWEENNQ
jgi:hypothetical protein